MSARGDLLTAVLATWMVSGVLADGWAHEHRTIESFITPWHAFLYAGFVALAGWIAWSGLRSHDHPGSWWTISFPAGYAVGMVGALIFWVSGIADFAWHQAFGIEKGDAALLSPSHLGLLAGSVLLTTTPLRSAWNKPDTNNGVPPVAKWSLALTTFTVSFLLHEDNPFWENPISIGHRAALRAATRNGDALVQRIDLGATVGAFIVTTLILFVPLIAVSRRWHLTILTTTLVAGFPPVAIGAVQGYRDPGLAFVGVVAAATAGAVIRISANFRTRWASPLGLALGASVFWAVYVAAVAAGDHGLGVKTEIWAGLIVWPGLIIFAVAVTPRSLEADILEGGDVVEGGEVVE